MTFEVILYEKLFYIVSIHNHIYFSQNQFINECARKEKAKFPEFWSFL